MYLVARNSKQNNYRNPNMQKILINKCDWIYGNRFKSHIVSYKIIDFKHYNQPKIVSTLTKLTQNIDHFTVFESFPSVSCCSQKFLPNKIGKIGWLDMRGSIRDVYIGWVAGKTL